MKTIKIINQDTSEYYTFQRNRIDGSMIGALEGFEYPSVIQTIEDVPNQGGAAYITSKFGRRRVGITAVIGCDRLEERILLGKVLRQTGRMKLVQFTTLDDLDLQFEAEVANLVNPYTKLEKPLLIELIAPDYRFYDQTLTTFNVNQALIGDDNVVANGGNEVSEPIFRITGPGNNFTITNDTTGESLVITYNLAATHYIEVDIVNHTIVLDGITNIYSSFAGSFFSLQPGDNTVIFDVASADTGATLLAIKYRDAYNGV